MFVRWKTRQLTGSIMRDPTKSLTAVLVESKRVHGKPRQRFVAYLGRIHEDLLEHDSHCLYRAKFWDMISVKLDQVHEPFDRAKVEASIAKVVPRPTPEQVATDEEEVARRRAAFEGQMAPLLRAR